MLFTFQESLSIPHVLPLRKALYKSKVWCPSSIISFVQKQQQKRHVVLLLPPELQQTMNDNQEAQISVVMSGAAFMKLTSAHLRIGINIICLHSLPLLHTKN
jgi:hypothetical protein